MWRGGVASWGGCCDSNVRCGGLCDASLVGFFVGGVESVVSLLFVSEVPLVFFLPRTAFVSSLVS